MWFASLSSTLITHIGLWDAVTNGNFLASAPLQNAVRVISGGR